LCRASFFRFRLPPLFGWTQGRLVYFQGASSANGPWFFRPFGDEVNRRAFFSVPSEGILRRFCPNLTPCPRFPISSDNWTKRKTVENFMKVERLIHPPLPPSLTPFPLPWCRCPSSLLFSTWFPHCVNYDPLGSCPHCEFFYTLTSPLLGPPVPEQVLDIFELPAGKTVLEKESSKTT